MHDIIEKLLLPPHVIAGFLSVIIFWLPALNRKGGVNHVRIGRWYVWCMWVVVITAALMSVENIYYGFYAPGAFLGFLSLVTAAPLWRGIAVLRHKQGLSDSFNRMGLMLEGGIVIFGAAMLAGGLVLGGKDMAILMIIFGILGVANAPQVWRAYQHPPQEADWLLEHVRGMITSGIACYTAFFAFGGRRFLGNIFTDYWMVIPWVLPTILGVGAIRIWRYRNRRDKVKQYA